MVEQQLKIAVVGASGVLGRSLLPLLQSRGHEIRAISRHPPKAATGIEPIEMDILADDASHHFAAAMHNCDVAIHIATAIPRDPSAPGAWQRNAQIRIEGTRRLLAACRAAQVGHYVQQSVIMAYPDGGDEWLSEDMPLDRTSSRAEICRPIIEMEQQVRAVPTSTMAWTILRGGAFVGAGTAQDAVIAELRNERPTLIGDGNHFISPVHVDDMARAFQLAVESPMPGAIFNVCAEPLRQREYLEQLARSIAAPPPRAGLAGSPPSWRCSSAAIRREFGWTPRHS